MFEEGKQTCTTHLAMATQRSEKRKVELDGSIRTDVANLEQHVRELDDKATPLRFDDNGR